MINLSIHDVRPYNIAVWGRKKLGLQTILFEYAKAIFVWTAVPKSKAIVSTISNRL